MSKKSNIAPIVFNYYSAHFTPYAEKENEYNDGKIIREVVDYIRKERSENKAVVIDRNFNQDNRPQRSLFINNITPLPKEQRIIGSIALIRAGRLPMIKKPDGLEIVPLNTVDGSSIVELTHFFIDYSTHQLIFCIEYNYNGPRWSDIEYYFRNVCKYKLRIAKHLQSSIFLSSKIKETLENLKEVLNLNIKVQPSNLVQLDPDVRKNYFSGLDSLQNTVEAKYLRFEASFQERGTGYFNKSNKKGTNLVSSLLKKFITRKHNIDAFEDFQVKYEDKHGEEQLFNLLHGKRESTVFFDPTELKKNSEWYEKVKGEFDNFMKTKNVTS